MCTGDQRPARDHDRTGVAARAGSAQRALPVRLQGIFPRGKFTSCLGYDMNCEFSKATCRKILPVGIYFLSLVVYLFLFVVVDSGGASGPVGGPVPGSRGGLPRARVPRARLLPVPRGLQEVITLCTQHACTVCMYYMYLRIWVDFCCAAFSFLLYDLF